MPRNTNRQNSGREIGLAGVPADGMVLLDLALRSVALDDGARTILGANGAAEGRMPVLPSEIAKALLTVSPSDLQPTTLRIGIGESRYTCEVFRMEPQNAVQGQPLLALYLKEEHSVGEAVRRAARLYRLTQREEETLFGVASGLTSRQIAGKMKISPNTVNAFLRLMMDKMGVTTRAGVVGKLINGKTPRNGPLPATGPNAIKDNGFNALRS